MPIVIWLDIGEQIYNWFFKYEKNYVLALMEAQGTGKSG